MSHRLLLLAALLTTCGAAGLPAAAQQAEGEPAGIGAAGTAERLPPDARKAWPALDPGPAAEGPLMATVPDDYRKTDKRFSGNASWYGPKFHGRRTASGRIFDMNKLTAAHRSLPFGTKILVENPYNGKSVIVEVIDRGPHHPRRVIDLSREAARRIDILLNGVAYVNCLVLQQVEGE